MTRGRPCLYEERMKHHVGLRVSAEELAFLKEIGDGKVSAGLRLLLTAARKAVDDCPDAEAE